LQGRHPETIANRVARTPCERVILSVAWFSSVVPKHLTAARHHSQFANCPLVEV
jgi:hypothetical protein